MRTVYGVIACLLMVSVYAEEGPTDGMVQWCLGDCSQGMVYAPQIDPAEAAMVMQRLGQRNRRYVAAAMAAQSRRGNYGYGPVPYFYGPGDLGLGTLSSAEATRGEYDLELQRRSLCAGFASNRGAGPEGVYAGRALDCRRDVFD
ncbi:MAG: hypothetical protein KAS38_13625 [Anaerolineales bacterium]|nr:hypothetical protein [Anaerolineales bacterium]